MIQKITVCTAAAAILLSLTACGAASAQQNTAETSAAASRSDAASDGKRSIVCTIFPEYDWVRQLLGDHAADMEITCLLDSGADLHSYQPTASDLAKIAECDLFVYVGGESDEWVGDALAGAVNPDMQVINLLETVGDRLKEEETVEGMEPEDDEDEPEYDEHVWLSLRNARLCCEAIANKLAYIDKEHATDYLRANDDYALQLARLDTMFQSYADNAEEKTLIFGDRFPFRYFADDYGFSYYAAFAGCSAETEASFDTIAFLAAKADELHCSTIYTLENSDRRIAETVIGNTEKKNQRIAALNSLQSVTKEQMDAGATYLSLMEQNLDVLRGISAE